ncbi:MULTISPECIES: DUF6113 family protein [unclassified Leifsonia]|uniref:DUF6113 family protein n=1 Tax=unclassified Leifsonia TaxID=2663824 RepID=UPI000A191BC7|nr:MULTISPECIES: DUF6113 family protein [unclassified Leifsonia]QIZ99195.1 hypothetical protein HF024_12190 [Leifsonia sp. PS1209]
MLSRIANYVLLFLVGAVVGAVGTVAHQATVTWGVPIPLGLIGSLAAYTALLVGLRLLGRNRIPTLVTAVGAILAILLFSQKSAGGSVLIPNNLLGQLWLAGPIVIAAIVLAWPDLSKSRRPAVAPAGTSTGGNGLS